MTFINFFFFKKLYFFIKNKKIKKTNKKLLCNIIKNYYLTTVDKNIVSLNTKPLELVTLIIDNFLVGRFKLGNFNKKFFF